MGPPFNTDLRIDCSHGNSGKDPGRQSVVAADVAAQLRSGSRHILGVMMESHLTGGRQDLVPGRPLTYGQSITDACLAWKDTVPALEPLAVASAVGPSDASSKPRSAQRRAAA